jgi:hypothetical protein
MSKQESDGMELATEALTATATNQEDEVELIDELELEYNNLVNNEEGENLISGYQQILNNSRNDDNAIKIKEKAIYG